MAQAAAAAAAAATPLQHAPRSWISFLFAGKPRRFFSFSPSRGSRGPRAHGLRPLGPSPAADGERWEEQEENASDSEGAPPARESRNSLKREARRAVRWGMELASFSAPQIKRVLRVASLDCEVFDALMLVKRLGPDVREGKRRQFNYIGRLLRKAEPELMDALIQASKDGDNDRLIALFGRGTWSIEDDEEDEETAYEEENESHINTAARWFDGLICKDPSITNEVYSIHSVEFDRQELRRLVRRVQSIQEDQIVDGSGVGNDAALTKAKKLLASFLQALAKRTLAE